MSCGFSHSTRGRTGFDGYMWVYCGLHVDKVLIEDTDTADEGGSVSGFVPWAGHAILNKNVQDRLWC